MTKPINVNIVGAPIAQGSLVGNPRFGGLRYSNDKILKEWRGKVIDALATAMPPDWNIDAAMKVSAQFRFVRPKAHIGAKGVKPSAPRHKTTKPDLDKTVRAIGDCIEQSGVSRNDSQVVMWQVCKRWSEDQEPPGVAITITPLV
tara:strand:+ start:3910 stop:4344 length:435 start_codon:yes stop_codon:yes gene_type:complete